ncbi:MAG: hypothetical protein M9915_16945 [Rhizobacter sp.]|nr:hypothetical protein [Rhizobacter sp.]
MTLSTGTFRASHSARRLHACGLIANIPRARCRRVTNYSRSAIGASVYMREHHPQRLLRRRGLINFA